MTRPCCQLESSLILVFMTLLITALWSSPAFSNPSATIFNVKNYGAHGDGEHEDGYAINRAIAAATAHPGSIVYFPAGYYQVDVNLSPVNRVTFKGDPAGKSVLSCGSITHLQIIGDSSAVEDLYLVNSILDAANTQLEAVLVSGATNYKITGCNISGWILGVHTKGDAQGQISTNTITTAETVSPAGAQSGIFLESAADTQIRNNVINAKLSDYGFGILDYTVQGTLDISDNTITNFAEAIVADSSAYQSTLNVNNNTLRCNEGVDCAGVSTVEVEANKIGNASFAVHASDCSDLKILNNSLDSVPNTAIYVSNSADTSPRSTISGNQITNLLPGAYGIYTAGTSITSNPNSTISNNVVKGSGYVGIYIKLQTIASVTNNNISGVQYGIYSDTNNPVTLDSNTISDIQNKGIYSKNDAFASFNKNVLKNCGLSSGADAVIYADSTFGQFTITDNTYTASSTPNLSYFVYAHVKQPLTVKGNKTNTLLPNYP